MDFAYHRSVAPMMWVLIVIASVELGVVHLLVSLWSRPAAIILSVLSLSTIVWLVMAIRSFRRLPVRIADGMLTMRAGSIKGVTVPTGNVARARFDFEGAELKEQGVRNLALVAYPNVLVELREPVTSGRRTVRAVAHRLDDPAAFGAALEQAMAA